ncbi:SRPBCC family protein [Streptomyces sp. NPDC004609]|uniref:SRPBCC family protein n=1 Tax=Streptomyces sp. NPDC004609 TaxID=3364704 RepID=UPI0036AC449D
MGVYNVHERLLAVDQAVAGALIDTLSSGDGDRLWPYRSWPRMRFDRALEAGAVGGHGPVRYTVTAYVPATWVRFAFTGPRGFHGFHEFAALAAGEGHTVLRHTLAMSLRGPARLTWPLVFRPLHDALLEDSLDLAERACTGTVSRPARRSRYVRLLRSLARTADRRSSDPASADRRTANR